MTRLLWEGKPHGTGLESYVLAVERCCVEFVVRVATRRVAAFNAAILGRGIFSISCADEVVNQWPTRVTSHLFVFFFWAWGLPWCDGSWKIKAMRRSLWFSLVFCCFLGGALTTISLQAVWKTGLGPIHQVLEWNPAFMIGDYWRVWPTIFMP
jgi:hypothetical protein